MKKLFFLLMVTMLSSCNNEPEQSYYLGYKDSEKVLSTTVETCLNDLNYIKNSQYQANSDAINNILNNIGVVSGVKLIPCPQINNAIALTKNGVRYILYDPNFLNFISKNEMDLPSFYILAHEIGHHVNGHTIDAIAYSQNLVSDISLKDRRKQEMEADYFAGRLFREMGFSVSESAFAIAALFYNGKYKLVDDEIFGEDWVLWGETKFSSFSNKELSEYSCVDKVTSKFSTHPNRSTRVSAFHYLGYNSRSNTGFDDYYDKYINRLEKGLDCREIDESFQEFLDTYFFKGDDYLECCGWSLDYIKKACVKCDYSTYNFYNPNY